MTIDRPWFERVIVSAVIGAIVLVALSESLRWVKIKEVGWAGDTESKAPKMAENKDTQVNVSGNNNVFSVNQSGGVVAGTYINQAPRPELRTINSSRQQNSDGTFTISSVVEVVAPYPPGSLSIKAIAEGIMDLKVMPQRTGASIFGHSGKRDGYAFETVMSPSGRYMIIVHTAQAVPINVEYEFQ